MEEGFENRSFAYITENENFVSDNIEVNIKTIINVHLLIKKINNNTLRLHINTHYRASRGPYGHAGETAIP